MGTMESFDMRHGIITYIDIDILALKFRTQEGFSKEAVAVRGVCYADSVESANLSLDFKPGQQIQFSAVLDQNSSLPEVWKAVVVWTTSKPVGAFRPQDYADEVAHLYRDPNQIENILAGITGTLTKNIRLERMALVSLYRTLKTLLREDVKYTLSSGNLEDLFKDVTAPVKKYITENHRSIKHFILYHAHVFRVSARGKTIFPVHPYQKFDNYMNVLLPERIHQENVLAPIKDPRPAPQASEAFKLYSLEKEGLLHFSSSLRAIQEDSGIVYSLGSAKLEELVDVSTPLMKAYIRMRHGALRNFVEFHKGAFQIGPCDTVFPFPESKIEIYISTALLRLVPECEMKTFEDTLTEIINTFPGKLSVKQPELGDLQSRYEIGQSKETVPEEEIFYSDDELEDEKDNIFNEYIHTVGEEAEPEILKVLKDSTTQTYSTGPIEIFSKYMDATNFFS